MTSRLVAVGRVASPHGSTGAVKLKSLTDFHGNLREGLDIFVASPRPFWSALERVVSRSEKGWVVQLKGIRTLAQAEGLVDSLVQIREADLAEPPEDSYYVYQIIGAAVVDLSGKTLGRLKAVLPGPANDVFVVEKPEGGEALLPAIKDVIRDVDPDAMVVRVDPWPGMME